MYCKTSTPLCIADFMYRCVFSPVECFTYAVFVVFVAHFGCRRFDWHISGSQTATALSPVAQSHFHVWASVKWMTAIKLHGVGAAGCIIGQVLAGSFTLSHSNDVNKKH